jgi:acid phosphatase type 7
MTASTLQTSRLWHRRIASLLFIFFFFIAVTGVMLGFKSAFTKIIFDNKQVKATLSMRDWLPLDSLEYIAAAVLNEKTANAFVHAESIQLKPAKAYISFMFKNNFSIQVDGATGAAIHIEQKNGGLIQDIHDGAVLGDWLSLKPGLSKTVYSTVMGLSLFFLTLSGFYLWYKPRRLKLAKKRSDKLSAAITIVLLLMAQFIQAQQGSGNERVFRVKPYLQIGAALTANSLQLLWQATDTAAVWTAEYRNGTTGKFTRAANPTATKVNIAGTAAFSALNTSLSSLIPGGLFTYRIMRNDKLVFTADGIAPRSTSQAFRFVASGDMGAGTKQAKEIAKGIYESHPDFVAIAGDIVYDFGLIGEYTSKFWPIYNADKIDSVGVPLMRSVPFVAAVGNHDADTRDLDKYPDALAYYLFWDQPLNGPLGKEGGSFVPVLKGSEANRAAFTSAAGARYPRMSNFSFNYGNAHWTVLDADTYVDWTDETLTAWVAKDLAESKAATWHFVLYHHPGFSSSVDHFEQQQMRLLAPVFEKGNVDIVFNGHVHNYQRSFPMQFKPDKKGVLIMGGKENKSIRGRVVNGIWKLDKDFDGKTNTKPKGVIYIVSGAGGQSLYNPEQERDPDSWQKFTHTFISTQHSFTVVDVNGSILKLKQLNADGKELDTIEIKK